VTTTKTLEEFMTKLDIVAKINQDIAALPAEYRALIVSGEGWMAKNPIATRWVCLGVGVLAGFVLAKIF
jgi:hypothetical protein